MNKSIQEQISGLDEEYKRLGSELRTKKNKVAALETQLEITRAKKVNTFDTYIHWHEGLTEPWTQSKKDKDITIINDAINDLKQQVADLVSKRMAIITSIGNLQQNVTDPVSKKEGGKTKRRMHRKSKKLRKRKSKKNSKK